MPFDPTLPTDGALIIAGELRSQFTGLHSELTALPTQAQLSNDLVNCQNAAVLTVLPQTSANSNLVDTFADSISDPPTQTEVQGLRDRLNELIQALRR